MMMLFTTTAGYRNGTKRNDPLSNVLILVGSMREHGNTQALAKSFAEGAAENNNVEIVSVADYKVGPCTGCNHCYTSKDNRCCQNDDMDAIYEKLGRTDVLVIASPVYFYGISAELKAIVDRLHTPLRNTFHIKRLGLFLVAATDLPDLFDPIVLQYEMILRFFHLESIGIVLVGGVKDEGDIQDSDALTKAKELGRSIRRLSNGLNTKYRTENGRILTRSSAFSTSLTIQPPFDR